MKRVVSILVIAAFLAAPMLVAAQQAKPATPAAPAAPAAAPAAPAVAPAAPAAPAAAPAAPAKPAAAKTAPAKKAVTVVGMVDEVKNKKGEVTGYTLKTDTETYSVAKGKKVAAMVGKKVEATGTVATVKGKKVLTVKQMKEAM
jgi:hypothetical protein